jgi:hypothetical protein
VADKRIPVPKPSADLEQVYFLNLTEPEPHTIYRYRTKYGKIFEREESKSRGVVWYQVVQQ